MQAFPAGVTGPPITSSYTTTAGPPTPAIYTRAEQTDEFEEDEVVSDDYDEYSHTASENSTVTGGDSDFEARERFSPAADHNLFIFSITNVLYLHIYVKFMLNSEG